VGELGVDPANLLEQLNALTAEVEGMARTVLRRGANPLMRLIPVTGGFAAITLEGLTNV
jgi:hypothetical protein